jgi:ABC-2 type transport system ATP-binding protein
VIASGSPRELTATGARNTLRFTGPAYLEIAVLQTRLPAETLVSEVAPGEYVVAGTIDPHVLAAVTAWCADLNVMPEGLAVERRTLEDVFLELTGRELRA